MSGWNSARGRSMLRRKLGTEVVHDMHDGLGQLDLAFLQRDDNRVLRLKPGCIWVLCGSFRIHYTHPIQIFLKRDHTEGNRVTRMNLRRI